MNDIFKYNRNDEDDYYSLLGCTIHSTDEQIQKEYKIRALDFHPDKCDPKTVDEKERCNEKFQKLKKAKEILLDKEKRILYDKWLLGGVMMSFDQFTNYTKNSSQSFHWACKKPDPMITDSTSKLEKRNSKLNLKDTPVFKSNDFIWSRNDSNESNDLLKKFRNYEI